MLTQDAPARSASAPTASSPSATGRLRPNLESLLSSSALSPFFLGGLAATVTLGVVGVVVATQ